MTKPMTANPMTADKLEALIVREHYFTAADGVHGALAIGLREVLDSSPRLGLLTFCVLELASGFLLVGQSACASHAHFDEQIGRDIARRDAFGKLWELECYAGLRQQATKE